MTTPLKPALGLPRNCFYDIRSYECDQQQGYDHGPNIERQFDSTLNGKSAHAMFSNSFPEDGSTSFAER
jgi:hypothetical protein